MNIQPLLIVALLAVVLLLAVLLLPVSMGMPLFRRLDQHSHPGVVAGTVKGKVLTWITTTL